MTELYHIQFRDNRQTAFALEVLMSKVGESVHYINSKTRELAVTKEQLDRIESKNIPYIYKGEIKK